MSSEETARPAILVLGELSLETAKHIRLALGDGDIYGLDPRVKQADIPFSDFGGTLRDLYEAGRPIIAICAAGIIIRALASLLENKRAEPPVLAVAEDGSAVVPLLGGLSGVNDLARRIAAAFNVAPAITTTGELRFGVNLLHPPAGYTLLNPEAGKTFISDLLAGEKVKLAGNAPWLSQARLPFDPAGRLTITVTTESREPEAGELLYLAPVEHKRGRLAVVGLGPGDPKLMAPAVRQELSQAQDILGYETYVRMAGPFRADQVQHMTDNREEMQRARHAFALAATGRSVVMVSSGDPGIFAMAAAVLEALHESDDPAWHGVELVVLPGISAAMAAAARIGAPLGHDFCILSLSDNLKPWDTIIQRLDHAAQADFAIALYNPISKARPWQLGEALGLLRKRREPQTPVVLGRDVGRPGEKVSVTTLGALTPGEVDMRTVVIIGSSTTQRFARRDGGEWVYTPRWYGTVPAGTAKPPEKAEKHPHK
ncbi:precorrin-3 methylase [Paramesorhizobium deserti]|uniref:Precorrin-3 methylase n=1 Tax=Paramesorhizobium deserti TaxID=1494590 RepID=A0A135HWD1_9HYPH|nr:precorrin-3B C(17)-methyltransferase [Paramesorhizobium deserti]KXF77461.1 precorrin-3 methylase [Paramesorhizobium deserti]